MKFTKMVVLALLATTLIFSQGCATTGANTQQTVAKVAIVLKTTANAGAVMAIMDNPANRAHIVLAVKILDQLLLDGAYKPGELVAALAPVIKELKKPEISLAVNTALNLYALLYGDYVSGKIAGNENAKVLLTALRDGAMAAVDTGNINNPGGPDLSLPVKK